MYRDMNNSLQYYDIITLCFKLPMDFPVVVNSGVGLVPLPQAYNQCGASHRRLGDYLQHDAKQTWFGT
mgnify:CR=1 FL=1